MFLINMAEPSFYPYGLGIAAVIALIIITQFLRNTNSESFGMVLLIACMIGAVASIVGVRIYILFKKN